MKRAWLGGMALAALTAAVPVQAEEWSKKYSVSGRPEVVVHTNDANVEIASGASNEVEARVTITGGQIKDLRISESQSGNRVQIDVQIPGHGWHLFSLGNHGRSVHINVRLPRESDLDVQTGDGNVTSEAVSGRIRINTGDGNIDAQGLKGDVYLRTGDGHIQGSDFDGTLRADTGDGHITLGGRFDALDLKSGDGSIEAEARNGSRIHTDWRLHTGDGHINLRLPPDFTADLEAHTGDGHISLDFPVTVSGSLTGSHIHGKMNGGGGSLSVTTGDGSIRIERI